MGNGISHAGFTIGGLLFPPLGQFLIDKYGVRGAYLLIGASVLNGAAGALIQRPPSNGVSPRKRSSKETPGPAHQLVEMKTLLNGGRRDLDIETEKQIVPMKNEASPSMNATNNPEFDVNGVGHLDGVQHPENENTVAFPAKPTGHANGFKASGVVAKPSPEDNGDIICKVIRGADDTTPSETRKNAGLFFFLRLPKFYLIAFSYVPIMFNMVTYLTVSVDLVMDRNFSKWDGVYVIIIYTIGDLAARIGSGWITDKGILTRASMMGTHLSLGAVALCTLALSVSYPLLVMSSLVVGWCNGASITLIAVLVMDLVDKDHFSVCYGVVCLLSIIPGLTRPFLIGRYFVVS